MLLGCEDCKVPFIDEEELVTHFTRDELKVIAAVLLKDWRVYVIAGLFLGAGVLLLYWQAREHIKTQIEQFHVTVSNQVVTAYTTATNELAFQFKTFATAASNHVAQAYSSVTNQIAEEFQTPRIKQTVETVAKGEARSILEAEVQPTVASFKEDALFIRIVARAQAYDFKAYQQLLGIAKQTNDNAKLANQVLAEIERSLQRERPEMFGKRTFGWVSGTNVYAIASYWEIGQSNRALALANEFKLPSARWAEWASAKADLETGSISNATVRFFSLTTNFPGMSQLPNQRYHVYRKIDWELFNRLNESKTP